MAKIAFGIESLKGTQSGQKSATVNAEPKLIANSTIGKFTITSPVSKALNIAVGENAWFLTNITKVEEAIANNDEVIVEWATENGVDLNTVEGQRAAVKEFTTWVITKGIQQYNSKGEELRVSVRYTKEEKLAAATANAEDFISNEDIAAKLAELMGVEEVTTESFVEAIANPSNEEVRAFVISCVEAPTVPSYTGSKTATTGSATGVGCQLHFSDTALWNQHKLDIENKEEVNRIYDVKLNEPVEVEVHNGYETVTVKAYPLAFVEDVKPMSRA